MFALETIIENSLYAIKYDDSDGDEFENHEFEDDYVKQNEFRRIFNNWSDPEYLEAFFYTHKADLQKEFYNYIIIEDAIEQTIKESLKLESKLIEIAENGKSNNYENLQTIFKPLREKDERTYPIPPLQESKVYGENRKSWLRIYALRIDNNVFIVTGGAIKLTPNMNERKHLLKELKNLKKVKQFLLDEGYIDLDSIIEYTEI